MIDLSREYSCAEKEYDLSAFDSNPNMLYELTVCHRRSGKEDIDEEILCVKNTMGEIKEEIRLLEDRITPDMEGLLVIAYEEDDSRPTPAYLVIRKELRN